MGSATRARQTRETCARASRCAACRLAARGCSSAAPRPHLGRCRTVAVPRPYSAVRHAGLLQDAHLGQLHPRRPPPGQRSHPRGERQPRHSRDAAGLSRASTRYEPAGREAAISPQISAISPHISRLDAVRARRQGSSHLSPDLSHISPHLAPRRGTSPPAGKQPAPLPPASPPPRAPRSRRPTADRATPTRTIPPESSNPVWVQSPGWCGRPNHGREDGTCAVHSEHRVSTRDLGRSGEIWGDRAVHSEQRVSTRGCERAANTAERGGECRRTRVLESAGWKARLRVPLLA